VQDRDEDSEVGRNNKLPLQMDQVRQHVVGYMQEHGIYKMRRDDILDHMYGKLNDSRVPTLNEIGETLREDFKVRYRREDGAAVRYRDPDMDLRRTWASRILGHMLAEDLLVISIDETHIRSDKTSRYACQFVANERPFMHALVNGMEDKHELPH